MTVNSKLSSPLVCFPGWVSCFHPGVTCVWNPSWNWLHFVGICWRLRLNSLCSQCSCNRLTGATAAKGLTTEAVYSSTFQLLVLTYFSAKNSIAQVIVTNWIVLLECLCQLFKPGCLQPTLPELQLQQISLHRVTIWTALTPLPYMEALRFRHPSPAVRYHILGHRPWSNLINCFIGALVLTNQVRGMSWG